MITPFDRFRKLIHKTEPVLPPPPAEPSPFEKQLGRLKDLAQHDNFPALLEWLDAQVLAAESQRNLSIRDHSALTMSIGLENGLKAVRTFLTSLKE